MDIDYLAGPPTPGSRQPTFHRFQFLHGVPQVRAHANHARIAPHKGSNRAEQIVDVLVVGVISFGGGVVVWSVRRCSSRLLLHADASARTEYNALKQRIARKTIRTMDSGAGRFACGIKAGQAGASIEIGANAAHGIVSSGTDRDHVDPDIDVVLKTGLISPGE